MYEWLEKLGIKGVRVRLGASVGKMSIFANVTVQQ
jgi:hypothetical protein